MANALASMAILKVNYDQAGRDILDNFVPFLADRALHLGSRVVSLPDLHGAIRVEYGISIPQGVLKVLAKKCARRGLFKRENGVLHLNQEALQGFDLSAKRAEARRQHLALVKRGVKFARDEFGIEISEDEVDAGLSSFIRDNSAPLLSAVVDGVPIAELHSVKDSRTRYLLGSFISHLHGAEPRGFEYLSAVVKGAILASALYFPVSTSFNARLDRLSIYADTTFLLRAVGASGPELEIYANEAILMATKLGARFYCFRHTFDEMLGVLDACERAVARSGRYSYGETTEYMLSSGWTQSDVIELKDNLEKRLSEIEVWLREKPDHVSRLTLDEDLLEKIIKEEVKHRSTLALRRDIDSLAAIYRARRGEEFRHLEDAKAVFVTHNTALARSARRYMRLERWDSGTVPLCVSDDVLTTQLWLKEPLAAPDLPNRAIIADCLAAMRPDDALWAQYVEKFEVLRDRGAVTDEDYILLRQSILVRSLIVYQTREVPEAFSEGTAQQVLEKARENIARKAVAVAEAKTESERQRGAAAAEELELAQAELRRLKNEREAEIARREENLRNLAGRIAHWIIVVVGGAISVFAFVGVAVATPWPGSKSISPSGIGVVLLYLSAAIFATLSLYGAIFGGSLSKLAKGSEKILCVYILTLLRKLGGRE
ncbi:hypothetical protein ACFHWV_06815 [Micromonospora sp. LOL_028]|uniref:hypothetical protein n=1 Tax=Micromonospora sp. LOL_028 TaxID=3345420 RepID=UPI003A86E9F1